MSKYSVITCALLLYCSTKTLSDDVTNADKEIPELLYEFLSIFVSDWQESFGKTLQCHLGSDDNIIGLKYVDYGCWCGRGKQAAIRDRPDLAMFAVDDIDHACRRHDQCYDRNGIRNGGNCDPALLSSTIGFDGYRTECTQSLTHSFSTRFAENSNEAKCLKAHYECDREMAEEVAKQPIPTSKKSCPHCVLRLGESYYRMHWTGKWIWEGHCYICFEDHEISGPVPC